MKNLFCCVLLCMALGFTSCSKFWGEGGGRNIEEIVAVANRGSGTLSFINAKTNALVDTIDLPGEAEPMYVVYVANTDKVYVGDRAQNQVHVLNAETYVVETSIDVGAGVFHMWADGLGSALWVNNDIDNSISVIALDSHTVTQTITLDAKPHDVFLSQDGTQAFVSILRPDEADQVYAFNALTYVQTGTVDVGEDPHLFHLAKKNKLFVPCQNTNQLLTLNSETLTIMDDTPLAGAHGISATLDQRKVFVTGINVNKLYQVSASTSELLTPELATSLAVPHNVVVNAKGKKVFVTHSGGDSDQVAIFKVNRNRGLMEKTTITTGTNPFGLTYYFRKR